MSAVSLPRRGKAVIQKGEGTKSEVQTSRAPLFFSATIHIPPLPTQENWYFDLIALSCSTNSSREDFENKRMEVLSDYSQNKLQGKEENKA